MVSGQSGLGRVRLDRWRSGLRHGEGVVIPSDRDILLPLKKEENKSAFLAMPCQEHLQPCDTKAFKTHPIPLAPLLLLSALFR